MMGLSHGMAIISLCTISWKYVALLQILSSSCLFMEYARNEEGEQKINNF
jgi:hypothetical protein